MTRFYRIEQSGNVEPYLPAVRSFALLGQGESIDALIDRAIEGLPEGTNGVVFEAAATSDVVTVAVAVRFKKDWTVTLAGDFRKDGTPQGRVEIKHTF